MPRQALHACGSASPPRPRRCGQAAGLPSRPFRRSRGRPGRMGYGVRQRSPPRGRDRLTGNLPPELSVPVIEPGRDAVHASDERHPDHPPPYPGAAAAPPPRPLRPRSPSQLIPNSLRFVSTSTALAAKSSNAFDVTLIIWPAMKGAPSAAPCSLSLIQHSHSRTAQPSKPYWTASRKSHRNPPARPRASGIVRHVLPKTESPNTRPGGPSD